MTPTKFFVRLAIITALGVLASVFGAITSSWWAAGLMGLGGAMVFTRISEVVLRGRVTTAISTKLGGAAMTWYFVQMLGETATIAVLGALFALVCGAHVASAVPFYVVLAVTWCVLCGEAAGRWVTLIPLWLATRK